MIFHQKSLGFLSRPGYYFDLGDDTGWNGQNMVDHGFIDLVETDWHCEHFAFKHDDIAFLLSL